MSCLLSIDLNTTRLNNQSYQNLINSTNYNNLEIHLYNYIEQKHNKLSFTNGEVIHKYCGSRKKVALDIPQALDIIEQCSKNNYEKVFILCGEFESEFLLKKLDSMNVTYLKLQPTAIRQSDILSENNNDTNLDIEPIKIPTSQNFNVVKNEKISQDTHLKLSEEKLNSLNGMIKSGDISTYTPKEKYINGTKLTAEQIKKIYTYIKLKQLQRERNTV